MSVLRLGFQKTWTSLWSCSWGFCGLQILHIQDHNQIGSVPSQKHILALHTSATSAAGVSAGVSAFTYRHKHGTVNNLWIICHFQPTNFTCIPSICTAKYTLKARWFVFALESLEEPEEQNMTTFTVVVLSCLKKFPAAPCTCCFANAFSSDILGVKVQKYDKVRIPLATKTYLQSSCWSSIFGLDGSLFPALVLLQATKLLQTPLHVHPCLHPSWTCSHEPPQLVFRPSPINRLIFTQTHQRVKGRNHFALSPRTIYACHFFDGLPKNMNQPLELQLGFLRPTDFAHPRSKSNQISTLPETYSGPTHFSHLGGRSFSRRLSFHLSSQTRYNE